jgi:hypothetical protein
MTQRIVFTGNDRPEYMRRTLESWAKVRGVGDAMLDFHLEPGHPEVLSVCTGVGFAEWTVHLNNTRLGVQANPFHAIWCGFNSVPEPKPHDFVILAEDDFVVGADILEYFAWAQEEFYLDKRVISVSATQFEAQGEADEVLLVRGWTGWVWGTWRDRWETMIAPDWTFNYEHDGWDRRIIDYWCGERGMVTAVPALSRSQHIGQYGGVHTVPAAFEEHTSRCFMPGLEPQQYRRREGEPVDVSYHHTGT